MSSEKSPVTHVKAGPVSIPIYYLPSRGIYRAKWADGSERRALESTDLAKLRARVRRLAVSLTRSDLDFSVLSPTQREAVRYVIDRNLTLLDLQSLRGLRRVTLSEAVEIFLVAKADRSVTHHNTLRTHLNQICTLYGDRPIASIAATDLDAWLSKLPNPRTRKNKRASLVALWRWARTKDYLPQDRRTAAESTDAPSTRAAKRSHSIETWAPSDLKTILENVPAEFLPWIVLSSFAGLRTYELFPDEKNIAGKRKEVLAWADIDFAGSRILVPAAVSKTAERRAIPLCDTLAAWLRPLARTGPICGEVPPWRPKKSWGGQSCLDRLSAALGTPWRRNALRHSFGTYRALESPSLSAVSLEMGNSERMIRSHYLDVGRTATEAAEWFTLSPASVNRELRIA